MAADKEAAKAALHPAAPQPRAKEQRLGQCGARSFCCLLRAKQLLLSDSLWFQSVVLCHSEANVYLSSQDTLLLSIPWVHAETGKEVLLGGPGGSSQWLKAVSGAGWQHPLIHPAEPSDPRGSDMIARLQPADALTHAHTYIHTCMQRPATSPRERAWQSKAASSQPCTAPHGRRTDGQTQSSAAGQRTAALLPALPAAHRLPAGSIWWKILTRGAEGNPPLCAGRWDRGSERAPASKLFGDALRPYAAPPGNKRGGICFNRWRTIFSRPFH